MGIKIEDIVFFAILSAVLAIAFWLLHGSPALENALVSFVVLIIMAEFMIWKKYFEVDKKSAVTFTKLRSSVESINSRLKNLEQGQEELLHHARKER